ncbi:hypothetical protein EV715DRAFT_297791 [Schizophyllum commune]
MSWPTTPPAKELSAASGNLRSHSNTDKDVEMIEEPNTRTDMDRGKHKACVRKTFLHYLADTSPFTDWAEHWATFTEDPIMIWQKFLSMAAVCDLTSFPIMCLELCLNQASNERNFSDFKIFTS